MEGEGGEGECLVGRRPKCSESALGPWCLALSRAAAAPRTLLLQLPIRYGPSVAASLVPPAMPYLLLLLRNEPFPLPSRFLRFRLPITSQLNHSFLHGSLLCTPLHQARLPCSASLSSEALTEAVIACFHDSLMDRSAPTRL